MFIRNTYLQLRHIHYTSFSLHSHCEKFICAIVATFTLSEILSKFPCVSMPHISIKLLQNCQWLDNIQIQRTFFTLHQSNFSGLTTYFWNTFLPWVTGLFFSLFLSVSSSPLTPLIFISPRVLSLILVFHMVLPLMKKLI